jgi:hypothetical protein
MEGEQWEQWEQYFLGWDKPLVHDREAHVIIIPSTFKQIERYESTRQKIRKYFHYPLVR